MSDTDEPTIFVTNDYWMRMGGILDPSDQKCLDEAGPEVQMVSLLEAIEMMRAQGIEQAEPQPGAAQRAAALESMREKAGQADKASRALVTDLLDTEKARFVRIMRCEKRCSWRAVAASCAEEWDADWFPPNNQIVGMALCERAAEVLGEDPGQLPWNDL